MASGSDLKYVFTEQAPKPAGYYSQAVIAGRYVYISGQLPIHPDVAPLPDGSFESQAAQALENMLAILAAAGGRPEHLARVTAYIVGVENWPCFDAVYSTKLLSARPARTVVPVPELHHGFSVEIDAIALLDDA